MKLNKQKKNSKQNKTKRKTNPHTHTYICIYVHICVCECVHTYSKVHHNQIAVNQSDKKKKFLKAAKEKYVQRKNDTINKVFKQSFH